MEILDAMRALEAAMTTADRGGENGVQSFDGDPVTMSFPPDGQWIVCLEDGKRMRSLQRHLRAAHNMSPDQYRTKWGLPLDMPLVAPAYQAAKTTAAQQMFQPAAVLPFAPAKEDPQAIIIDPATMYPAATDAGMEIRAHVRPDWEVRDAALAIKARRGLAKKCRERGKKVNGVVWHVGRRKIPVT